jgi:hypothetical protein
MTLNLDAPILHWWETVITNEPSVDDWLRVMYGLVLEGFEEVEHHDPAAGG